MAPLAAALRDPVDTRDRELELVERIAYWMDRRYVDPVLGFVLPGAGDVIGATLGVISIVMAVRLGAHPVVIARMFINLAVDSVIGAIPFIGEVFDIFYRAHTRNLVLLREREEREVHASDWLVVGAAACAFLVALSLPILLLIASVRWLAGVL